MNTTGSIAKPVANRVPALSVIRERRVMVLLGCLAAIHVFIFSAAFPLFNNVDEPTHFDLVVKYSRGHIPAGAENMSIESVAYLARYHSKAYFAEPDPVSHQLQPPPVWTLSPAEQQRELAGNEDYWRREQNYESSQPPLYYSLAAVYWQATHELGIPDRDRPYALRFFNIFFVVALVWLGYGVAREIFPANPFLRMAVPALLAAMPQSAFYSIGNDILSPLCFGIAFLALIRLLNEDVPGLPLAAGTGLAIAATYLSKLTNLPLVAVAFIVVLLKARRLAATGKLRATFLAVLFGCALLPVAAWMIVCKTHFGDLTGANLKMAYFGWTYKTFGEWWQHPLFSATGIWAYLEGQLSTFWQGEFWWHGKPMGSPLLNMIYSAASLLFLFIALVALWKQRSTLPTIEHETLALAAICVITALGFFAFLSIVYDFHQGLNPSRAFPYFHAGRMVLGMLIPFTLLFLYGMDRALDRFGLMTKYLALGAFVLFMLLAETITDRAVFANEYNWFHL
jgi:Predicted membrane protein (DUF2142)